MKWEFSKGTGSISDLGGRGSQGEYYYIPSKRPTLKAPAEALGIHKNDKLNDYLYVYSFTNLTIILFF